MANQSDRWLVSKSPASESTLRNADVATTAGGTRKSSLSATHPGFLHIHRLLVQVREVLSAADSQTIANAKGGAHRLG